RAHHRVSSDVRTDVADQVAPAAHQPQVADPGSSARAVAHVTANRLPVQDESDLERLSRAIAQLLRIDVNVTRQQVCRIAEDVYVPYVTESELVTLESRDVGEALTVVLIHRQGRQVKRGGVQEEKAARR